MDSRVGRGSYRFRRRRHPVGDYLQTTRQLPHISVSVSWLSISMCPQDEDEGQATYEYSNSCLYTYDFNYQMLMHVRRFSL